MLPSVLAACVLLLALVYSTAAWEEWGTSPPRKTVLAVLALGVGAVWTLALQARGASIAWAFVFTALVLLVVGLLDVGRKSHGEHDRAPGRR